MVIRLHLSFDLHYSPCSLCFMFEHSGKCGVQIMDQGCIQLQFGLGLTPYELFAGVCLPFFRSVVSNLFLLEALRIQFYLHRVSQVYHMQL